MNEAVLIINTIASAAMALAWHSKDRLNFIIKAAWWALFFANMLAFR